MAHKTPEEVKEKAHAQEVVFERDVMPYKRAVQNMYAAGVSYADMAAAEGSYSVAATFERLADMHGTRSPAPYTIESVRAALRKYLPEELENIEKQRRYAEFDQLSPEEQAAEIAALQARQKSS